MPTRRCLRAGILHFSPLPLLLGANSLSVVTSMLRLTVAAFQNGGTIVLREFLVPMVTSAPKTSWELLAVDPDVPEPLAVVALR
jgi:hypothetical protein